MMLLLHRNVNDQKTQTPFQALFDAAKLITRTMIPVLMQICPKSEKIIALVFLFQLRDT